MKKTLHRIYKPVIKTNKSAFSKVEVYCYFLFSCYVVSDSYMTPRTLVCQALLSMGFLRQDTGDLPDPGVKPVFAALAGRFFTTEPPGKTCNKLGQDKSSIVFLLGSNKYSNENV